MPLVFKTGNILNTTADALVVPVNTVGVLGKGLALAVKQRWPNRCEVYHRWCEMEQARGGSVAMDDDHEKPLLVWFATKEHWRGASELAWIERGLVTLATLLHQHMVELDAEHMTVAVPLLGCSLGGLDPVQVAARIGERFGRDRAVTAELWQERRP